MEEQKKSTHRVEVVPVVLEPHPNADSLSITHVWGFSVVVRTEDWKDKTIGAYIQPDSLVPANDPAYAFLNGRNRITVKKFRGVFSQGLLVAAPEGSKVGDDVSEILGVTRYEPPEPLSFGGDNVKAPSGFIPKYDVESWNRYKHVFTPDDIVVVTEKLHGANARFTFSDGTMFAGSHTQWKKENPENLWWKALVQNPWIREFCEKHSDLVVMAEVFGQVQDLKYGAQKNQFFVRAFDIWNKLEARFLDWDEIFLCYDFPRNNSTWVPVLYTGPYDENIIVPLANGKSTIQGADNVREGIVIGTITEQYNNEVGRKKLKIVSNEYLERSK